jgi:glucokinase
MIGFDIGGTKCAVCIGEEKEGVLFVKDKRVISTDHSISPYEMIDKMCALAEEMTDKIDVIGISCGGPLDSKKGIIMSPPNLPGWDDIKIVDYLKEKYSTNVYLENDANACAVAEWKYGAGKGTENMIFMTFGTGLGAGLILDGKLYRGANDMAGEAGHIRLSAFGPVGYGKAGSFEGFCSGGGIAQLGKMYAQEKLQMGKSVSFCSSFSELENVTAKSIAKCAYKGEQDAIEIYKTCGEMLGKGLSILIDILNPERIVLGSIFQRSENLIRPKMQEMLEKECLGYSLKACKVVPAELGDNIGDYAALAVAAMNEEM